MSGTPPLTEAQRLARHSFDLDAAMQALPPASPARLTASCTGAAGVRLRSYLVADISDPLLREFAHCHLGAVRCSERYLDALRVVLGNQADVEQHGYTLELNQRTTFAPPRVMRQIIDQMRRAGITRGTVVTLGRGRSQVVQCYLETTASSRRNREAASATLERMRRAAEAADDKRKTKTSGAALPTASDLIAAVDVPY
jgi:hypothetical protein